MKLELKHVSPYLPYGLRIFNKDNKGSCILSIGSIERVIELPEIFKPILRPLSDLTKEVLQELRESENDDSLLWGVSGFSGDLTNCAIYQHNLTYSVLNWLYKNHFDIFGLIEEGLAIDINILKETT